MKQSFYGKVNLVNLVSYVACETDSFVACEKLDI